MHNRIYLQLLALTLFTFICVTIYCADLGVLAQHLGGLLALPGFDKVAHLLLYGMLAFSVSLAWSRKFKLNQYEIYWASALVLGFALLEEFSQMFMSTRTADIGDALADLVGVFLAAKAANWCNSRLSFLRHSKNRLES